MCCMYSHPLCVSLLSFLNSFGDVCYDNNNKCLLLSILTRLAALPNALHVATNTRPLVKTCFFLVFFSVLCKETFSHFNLDLALLGERLEAEDNKTNSKALYVHEENRDGR